MNDKTANKLRKLLRKRHKELNAIKTKPILGGMNEAAALNKARYEMNVKYGKGWQADIHEQLYEAPTKYDQDDYIETIDQHWNFD